MAPPKFSYDRCGQRDAQIQRGGQMRDYHAGRGPCRGWVANPGRVAGGWRPNPLRHSVTCANFRIQAEKDVEIAKRHYQKYSGRYRVP